MKMGGEYIWAVPVYYNFLDLLAESHILNKAYNSWEFLSGSYNGYIRGIEFL